MIADDYFDFFDALPEQERNSVYRTAFGRPDLFERRVAALQFKSAIPAALIDVPDRILVAGRIFNEEEEIVAVTGPDLHAEAPFIYTRIGTHFGWVHRDGLALTISIARKEPGGGFVHETNILIDEEADCSLDDLSTDLHDLIMAAVPGALLSPADGSFSIGVNHFALATLRAVIRSYGDASRLPGWDHDAVQLRDLNDPRTQFAIMLLGSWAVDPASFPTLGVYIDSGLEQFPVAQLARVMAPGRVTVVLETARKTVIATVFGVAVELWWNGALVGLSSIAVERIRLEFIDPLGRLEENPEIVLGEGLSLVIEETGIRTSETPFWRDGLGYARV